MEVSEHNFIFMNLMDRLNLWNLSGCMEDRYKSIVSDDGVLLAPKKRYLADEYIPAEYPYQSESTSEQQRQSPARPVNQVQ